MKFTKIIVLVLILVSIQNIFSVEEIKNENSASNKIEIKKIHSYKLEKDLFNEEITSMEIWKDKIWYMNSNEQVVVMNLQGEIIDFIDQKGKGPGEILGLMGVFWDRKNDYITLSDVENQRFSYFDENLNFVGMDKMKVLRWPMAYHFWNKLRIEYNFKVVPKTSDSDICIELYNNEKYKSLMSFITTIKTMPESYPVLIYDFNNENLFISGESYYENYMIKVYDKNGDYVKVIKKDYDKIKRTVAEIEIEKQHVEDAKKSKLKNAKLHDGRIHYPAVRKIFCVDDEIFVLTQSENKKEFFDVYNHKGKLIKQSNEFKDSFNRTFSYYKGKFYEIQGNYEDGFFLDVYEAELK